ncbi:hypothetical protein BT96DRAFT_953206 [Gymnopus androsaceus JB14]|uniref:Uncharacterized protein n=1 Tax=Gymnopus androsaceus JB14 TaxID=1447944 RepID=A0A6A4ILY2_9AGAR|nr:hypothetical protein BT96DRAFT_953206 [Gymnopus androsaceus JB14]
MDYDRNDALLHHIFKLTQGDAWFRPAEENLTSGVALRVSDDPVPTYRIFPYEQASLEPFEAAVSKLGPAVAVKVRSAAVHAALSECPPDADSLYVDSNTRIQIIDTMLQLPFADKEQSAAFIRDERVMVVWSGSLDRIIPICQDFDDRLIKLLWRTKQPSSSMHTQSFIGGGSVSSPSFHPPVMQTITKRTWYGAKRTVSVPASSSVESPRKLALYAPIYNGLAAGLALVFIGNGVKTLVLADSPTPEPVGASRYLRFVLAVTLPFLYCVSLFFTLQIIQNITMAFGPIAHYHENSRFYSAVPTPAPADQQEVLPHITIQMPVYRESLETVLAPSIASLKRAMQTYARQGGTSSIFVCDDGLRTSGMTRADRDERIRYYRSEGVAWVARPREGCPAGGVEELGLDGDPEKGLGGKGSTKKKGGKAGGLAFHRAGRFKKASNMNYGLSLSLCMERHLLALVEKKANSSNGNGSTERQLDIYTRCVQPQPQFLPRHNTRPGAYGSYGMQYLNRDGDDMHVGGMNTNAGSSFGGAFPSASHPLMGGSRGSPVSPNGVGHPTSPHPLEEAYYELGMEALGAHNAYGNGSGNDFYDDEEMMEDLEEEALAMAIEEMYEESRLSSSSSGQGWKPWAANGKAMRVGEIVLLVDSDTVVPEDCLRDAAREMAASPNVAIIQHESDVMQGTAHHYFENGIAYFTRRINRCISMACANGEIAPFVGHNAFLRWRAIQDAAFSDPADNNRITKEKMWSESNVSEDFDMALRLLGRGYDIRWATYSNGGFKEGVSLTVDDELNRWQKYAYGCNELLFNPLVEWWRRGPIARQIHRFIWSNAPVHYKISMMAYMFSYYGIAASITIGTINYILLGFAFPVDGFYMHSFEIWLATTVVFFGSGNVGYTLLEYRLGKRSLFWGFLENIMWIPFFFFFFGGLSIPVSQAILAHLFSYNITWSATVKEVQRSNFFKEIPKIAKRFWFSLLVSFVIIVGMIIVSTSLVPFGWRITGSSWAVIFPLAIVTSCHILFPIVLNPWLMVFSY